MHGILGYPSLYTRLETITSWEPIVTGIELLWHAQVWNVSSERWFIVVPWFIRSTTERSNSPGPFIFQKGWGSSSKHTAKSLIQMWYVNICKRWSSIGPMLLRQKRRESSDLAVMTGNWNESRRCYAFVKLDESVPYMLSMLGWIMRKRQWHMLLQTSYLSHFEVNSLDFQSGS